MSREGAEERVEPLAARDMIDGSSLGLALRLAEGRGIKPGPLIAVKQAQEAPPQNQSNSPSSRHWTAMSDATLIDDHC